MSATNESENMVKYQFQMDNDEWEEWKETVSRSKSLETRIQELVRADTGEGVVKKEELRELAERWHENSMDESGYGKAAAELEEVLEDD